MDQERGRPHKRNLFLLYTFFRFTLNFSYFFRNSLEIQSISAHKYSFLKNTLYDNFDSPTLFSSCLQRRRFFNRLDIVPFFLSLFLPSFFLGRWGTDRTKGFRAKREREQEREREGARVRRGPSLIRLAVECGQSVIGSPRHTRIKRALRTHYAASYRLLFRLARFSQR